MILAMKMANIHEVKDRLSGFVDAALRGEEVVICRRNKPVVHLVAIRPPAANRTRLGWAVGEGEIHDDLEGPFMPEDDWRMLDGG